jgi:hypothetical protein
MVATATVRDNIGGSANTPAACPTVVTNLRYKEADNNTQDLNNPVTIPPTCTPKYSYWKHTFVVFTGCFTQICNINWFVECFNWTGTTLTMGNGVQAKSSGGSTGYDPAVGLNILTTHDTICATTDAGATYTSSCCGRAGTISECCAQIDAACETTDYFVTNLALICTAVSGTQTAKTVTIEYDEI